MTKLDPIIAVKDVDASGKWYQQIFGFKNVSPAGHNFAVLKSETNEIIFCLHKWNLHDHPTFNDQSIIAGNGFMLYFRTENMEAIKKNLDKMGWIIEEEIHLNENSLRKEFAFRDPDGYFLTVSEFHEYE